MRSLRTTLIAAALAGSMGVAFAAGGTQDYSAQGTIAEVDMEDRIVTFDNGATYPVPETFDISSLQVGEVIRIEFVGATTSTSITKVD